MSRPGEMSDPGILRDPLGFWKSGACMGAVLRVFLHLREDWLRRVWLMSRAVRGRVGNDDQPDNDDGSTSIVNLDLSLIIFVNKFPPPNAIITRADAAMAGC